MYFLTNFLYHTGRGTRWVGIILFYCVFSHSLPLEAQAGDSAQPCVAKLKDPSLKNIDCTLNFDLDESIRKDLKGVTAGLLRNAACKVRVSVAREKIFTALLNERVLEVPRQPVDCLIITHGDPLSTQFTLAPKVWFEGGKAVHVKPGMRDLLGMPPFLAKLLTDWVNSSRMVESAMVQEVNKFLKIGFPL